MSRKVDERVVRSSSSLIKTLIAQMAVPTATY